jgi:hypothetical protein
MEYVCPHCKSDNIQRLSVVYEGGLSNIDTKSRGTGIALGRGGIGLGVGSSRTKGTSQTAASEKASPPPQKTFLKPLLGIAALFIVLGIVVGKSVPALIINGGWLAASAAWIYFAFQYNKNTWPALKAKWDNSFLCNRCNAMFSLSPE